MPMKNKDGDALSDAEHILVRDRANRLPLTYAAVQIDYFDTVK